ncbi:cell division protein FtsQ [Salinisphaera orenii MK-B5]|uniref:Cell division protein FtsQ n=2 Tax=Salinisphaera orenii TaxID=856731 RepID=A0A423PHC7_9GAMM|nr:MULTISPECIES: cell division protein FtsQ/DivIB [Salinisphaera]ROO25038.1 cell division protein FtsQ [Salinisphaera orenii MK-B5]ROO37655.1 cell division protein FtsQ [Salinisphaera halophila YIM 95161]
MNWPDPRRWRDVVLGAGLLLGVAACTWQGIKPDGETTRHLYISGEAGHVSDDRIAALAAPYLDARFFDVDIEALQDRLAALPWLADVSVSRHWPDGVVVRITEHRPVALWGEDGVLAEDGRVFRPGAEARPQGLVRLDGPEASAERVQAQYRALADILSASDVEIARLTLDARGSWTATLADGLELRLGRDGTEARLRRFVEYALGRAEARRALANAGYVDLRYSDGFAVGGSRPAPETGNDQEKVDEQAA